MDLHLRETGPIALPTSETGGEQVGPRAEAQDWTVLYLSMKAMGATFPAGTTAFRPSRPLHLRFRLGTSSCYSALIYNPAFSDWLMGWPIGWTAAEGRVTEFAAWLQRMRGALLQLPSATPEEVLRRA